MALAAAVASYVVGGIIGSTLSIHSLAFVLVYIAFIASSVTALVYGILICRAWVKARI